MTAILGVLAFALTRSTSRNAAERAIGDLYLHIARLRVEHPEILSVARSWEEQDWARLYASDASAYKVVRYYSYVELCLEFCNTALRARKNRLITGKDFTAHYESLVRYAIVENWPIINQMRDASYLSPYVRQEISRTESTGWDWAAKHEKLTA